MKKLIRNCLVVATCFFCNKTHSQVSTNYTTTVGTNASMVADKNGNSIDFSSAVNLIPNNSLSVNAIRQAIGFSFVYMGYTYTDFIAGGNGQLALGLNNSPSSILSSFASNALTRSFAYPPALDKGALLAPFWDALKSPLTGPTIRTTITGAAPNRCRIIEWNVLVNSNSTTSNGADAVFQLRLYEGTNEIEYVYGQMNIGPNSSTVTSSIGMTAGNADSTFLALQNLSSFTFTPIAANEIATRSLVNSSIPGPISGLHSTVDGSRRFFRFTPRFLQGHFTGFQISGVTTSTIAFQWTHNFSNVSGYRVNMSTDNVNFSTYASLPASSSAYTFYGLQNNKRYYFKVFAFTEGDIDSTDVVSDSTRCDMAGTFSVGPTGYFKSIKQGIDSLGYKGMTGSVIFELKNDYNSTTESFPITIRRNFPCRQSNYTLTIRPAANATNVQVINNGTSPIFILDSTDNVILDGRPGGSGNSKELTLTSMGPVIALKNSWNNNISYIKIKSGDVSSTGAVSFEGSKGNGCDNNVISQCDLSDNNNSWSRILINSFTSNNVDNVNNQVVDCNLYNFKSYGICLRAGSKGWTIKDNSFYATALYVPDTSIAGMIMLADHDTTFVSHVDSNYFGGSAPHCGGSPYAAVFSGRFFCITNLGNVSIKNNYFRRIVLTQNSPLTVYGGAGMIVNGEASSYYTALGDIRGNQIGGSNPPDSISVYNAAHYDFLDAAIVHGLSAGRLQVDSNSFENIIARSTSGQRVDLSIVKDEQSFTHITNNRIGQISSNYSIYNFSGGSLTGIFPMSNSVTVQNNVISRMWSEFIVTGIGLQTTSSYYGTAVIQGNTVCFLTSSYNDASGSYFYVGVGITAYGMGAGKILNNRIFAISSAIQQGHGDIMGLRIVNGFQNIISGNFIHSLQGISSVYGINTSDPTAVVENNMIRLGFDSVGNSIVSGVSFYGIANSARTVIRHNSIYIGGTGTVNGYAGLSGCIYQSDVVIAYNNILVNKRTLNSSDNPSHFIIFSGVTANYGGYDRNVYFLSGSKTRFYGGVYDNFDSLQLFRMTTGNDLHSIQADPNFINADGPGSLLDMHVASPTPVEGKGDTAYTTQSDFDGQIRNTLTPVDIGADAGGFTLRDNWRPELFVDSVPDHLISNDQVLTVKIKDDTGVDTTSSLKPRMWLRRFYPTTSSWYNVSGNLITGNFQNGTWKFTVNYASLGLPISGTDSIECYFVAQDLSSYRNVGYSPIRNNNHSNVATQYALPVTVHKYKIWASLPDTLYVGAGQTYTSLTNNLGAFQAINSGLVGQNGVTIVVTSDLTETGTYGLLQYPKFGPGGTLKIITNSSVVKNIIASNGPNPLIFLDRCKNISIDGSVNGSGRYMRIVNRYSFIGGGTQPAIQLADSNKNIVLRNLIVESNANVANIQVGNYNENVLIRNNEIKPATGVGASGYAYVGVYTGDWNDKLRIINNEISNFRRAGIDVFLQRDSCIIDSNQIFYNISSATNYREHGIIVNEFIPAGYQASGGNIISNNFIGGSAPNCGGAPWNITGVDDASKPNKYFIGISIQSSPASKSYIFNNTIQNIQVTTTTDFNFTGIYATGLVDIGGRGANMIGHPSIPNSIQTAASGVRPPFGLETIGIEIANNTGSNVANNIISNITATATTHMSVMGIQCRSNDSAYSTIDKNTIQYLTSSGSQTQPTDPFSVAGIYLFAGPIGYNVTSNEIGYLKSSGTSTNKLIAGILADGNARMNFSRNRIHDLENSATSGGEIAGIVLTKGYPNIVNNQITLTNGSNTNPVLITGIRSSTTSAAGQFPSLFYYNSIGIGGSASGGSANSYAFNYQGSLKLDQFKNNILYNTRNGGTGNHLALGVNTSLNAQLWPAGASDFNFMVTNDTAHTTEWSGAGVMSLRTFKSISNSDASSFSSVIQNVPSNSLFANMNTGNLDINSSQTQCWYVNGKGLPVAGISGDFDSSANVRSTNISTGATDIGSDEFNTTLPPTPLVIYGAHTLGGADTLAMNSRIVAIINWNNTGALPTLGEARWYSGVWPNDTTNNNTISNARYMNGYWQIPATGGSNYSYSLTLFYDSSMLGKVIDASSMIVNKKQEGVVGSWIEVKPTILNGSQKSITINNQSSFSEFTCTDSAATFVHNSTLPDLKITSASLSTSTASVGSTVTANFMETNDGNVFASANKVYFYLSSDNILSPGDLLLGQFDITISIAPHSTVGSFAQQLTIPCSLLPGGYYLFMVADGANVVPEGNEINNSTSLAISLTASTVPPTPSVSITYSGCPSTTLVFQANPTNGGTNPQYQWLVNNVPKGTGAAFTLDNATNGAEVTCKMTVTYQCASAQTASAATTVNCITTAVTEIDGLESFSFGPNPNSGVLILQLKLTKLRKIGFRIIDNTGKIIYKETPAAYSGTVLKRISLENVGQGVYFLETTINDNKLINKLILGR